MPVISEFYGSSIDIGGHSVVWDKVMDIAGEELYMNGVDDINEIQNQ